MAIKYSLFKTSGARNQSLKSFKQVEGSLLLIFSAPSTDIYKVLQEVPRS